MVNRRTFLASGLGAVAAFAFKDRGGNPHKPPTTTTTTTTTVPAPPVGGHFTVGVSSVGVDLLG